MRNDRLNEIRAFYLAYKSSERSAEYMKKALDEIIENYLTLYIINYAADGNEIPDISPLFKDYYDYGLKLKRIREYDLRPNEIWKLQDAINVPF